MPIIRRTLLIFLILISVSATAFGASPIVPRENYRMGVDPSSVPNRSGTGWPDNGEPDDGNKQGGDSESDPLYPRGDLVSLVRWFGQILMARNLGSRL
jgi:hypothetical protein